MLHAMIVERKEPCMRCSLARPIDFACGLRGFCRSLQICRPPFIGEKAAAPDASPDFGHPEAQTNQIPGGMDSPKASNLDSQKSFTTDR